MDIYNNNNKNKKKTGPRICSRDILKTRVWGVNQERENRVDISEKTKK